MWTGKWQCWAPRDNPIISAQPQGSVQPSGTLGHLDACNLFKSLHCWCWECSQSDSYSSLTCSAACDLIQRWSRDPKTFSLLPTAMWTLEPTISTWITTISWQQVSRLTGIWTGTTNHVYSALHICHYIFITVSPLENSFKPLNSC